MRQNLFGWTLRGWSVARVRRAGRKDGRDWRWLFFPFKKEHKDREPPANQAELAALERELEKATTGALAALGEHWEKADERLLEEYTEALHEYDSAKRSLAKEAAEAKEAMREHEQAREKVRDLGLPAMSAKARNLWLLAFAVFEFPLNATVFQIFKLSPLGTALVAASMGIAIPGLAHATGHGLRQEIKSTTDKFLMWAGVIAALALFVGVALMRSNFIGLESQLGTLGINLNPNMVTTVFIIINAGIFVTAMIISYHGTHPQARRFKQANRRLKEARRSLRKEAGEAAAAQKRLDAAAKAVDLAYSRRQKRFEAIVAAAESLIQSYETLVRVYRRANVNVRPASDRPQCFKADPQRVNLPTVFHELGWPVGSSSLTPSAATSSAGTPAGQAPDPGAAAGGDGA